MPALFWIFFYSPMKTPFLPLDSLSPARRRLSFPGERAAFTPPKGPGAARPRFLDRALRFFIFFSPFRQTFFTIDG